MAANKTRMLHDADGQLHICRKDGRSNAMRVENEIVKMPPAVGSYCDCVCLNE